MATKPKTTQTPVEEQVSVEVTAEPVAEPVEVTAEPVGCAVIANTGESLSVNNSQPVTFELQKLVPNVIFERATDGSAGYDLRAMIDEPITLIRGGRSVLIPTGLKIHIKDPNYAALIIPRSGNGHKRGLVVGNQVGLIDSDYQGQWYVSAWARPNRETWEPVTEADQKDGDTVRTVVINPGDKIAQVIFVPVFHPSFTVVESFSDETVRGAGGFNSTGT